MKILGLDTTRKSAIIFLLDGDKRIVKELSETEKQSENLMIRIDEVLNKSNINLKEIDCFAIVTGPGSFTGIRVGMATIKAFAYALKKPIISFNVFELIGNFIKEGTVISECTSNSVYYSIIKNNKIIEVGVEEKTNINKFKDIIVLQEEHFLDNEAYKYNVLIIDNYIDLLFKQVLVDYDNKNFANSPEPYYVQKSQAERNLEAKND